MKYIYSTRCCLVRLRVRRVLGGEASGCDSTIAVPEILFTLGTVFRDCGSRCADVEVALLAAGFVGERTVALVRPFASAFAFLRAGDCVFASAAESVVSSRVRFLVLEVVPPTVGSDFAIVFDLATSAGFRLRKAVLDALEWSVGGGTTCLSS